MGELPAAVTARNTTMAAEAPTATRRGPASSDEAEPLVLDVVEIGPKDRSATRETRLRILALMWLLPITLAAEEWRKAGFVVLGSEMFWSKPWTRPIPVTLLVMWGYVFNNWVFSRSGISQQTVFGVTPPDVTEAIEAALAITWASATLHLLPVTGVLAHYTVFDVRLTDPTHHLLMIVLLIGAVLFLNRAWGGILRPFNIGGLAKILFECFTAPISPVTFTHVIIADYLTSLAKTIADVAITSCVASAVPALSVWPNAEVAHDVKVNQQLCTHSMMVPAVILIPTAVRVLQCAKVYSDSGDKLHLVNLVKYLTTVPVVLFSILKKTSPEYFTMLEPVWAVAVVVNSTYSFSWDIMMDWGLLERPNEQAPWSRSNWRVRQTRRYPAAVDAVIILLNAVLRYTWAVKLMDFSLPLKPGKKVRLSMIGGEAIAFVFNALEVFRRNCWAVLRVEWEEVKISRSKMELQPDCVMELEPLQAQASPATIGDRVGLNLELDNHNN